MAHETRFDINWRNRWARQVARRPGANQQSREACAGKIALLEPSRYPAQAIGQSHRLGRFANGTAADIVALSDDLNVKSVWIGGESVFAASASSLG